MRSDVGGNLARAARAISLCALSLGVLVESTGTVGGEVGTAEYRDENSKNPEEELTSPATPEPCKISRIDVGQNLALVARCACQTGDSEDDYYYYDSYEDGDYGGNYNARILNSRRDNEADASQLGEVETNRESAINTAGAPATVPTGQPSGASDRKDMVKDGTPCMAWMKPSEPKVVAGVCHQGKCNKKNRTTYTIPTTKPPPFDPFEYHCKVNKTLINSQLEVALGCVASCLEETSENRTETRLDDGRLCALDAGSGESDYVKRTGVCRNGSCVTADFTPWTHPNGCIGATTRRFGRVLAIRCTDHCKNNTKQRLPDGTPCLLNYKRKVKVPHYVPSLVVDGICKSGQCIIIPPTVPVMTVTVPEDGCSHFISSVSYTEKVETTCKKLCGGSNYKSVTRGTLCARKTAGKWSRVTEVGQCVGEECLDKGPDSPPPHERVNEQSFNCHSMNYLTAIPRQLIVVLSCKVECAFGKFENRKDGVRCLLEYNVQREKTQSSRQHGTYIVGVCKSGYCTLGEHPLNTTTEH